MATVTDCARPQEEAPSSPTKPETQPTCHLVHWFRKGLRLHDNPALREGLVGATTFRCIFLIDPWFASASNVGINKWRFLLQCLEDLDNSLKKLNSRLFVVRGQPADALPRLFREWGTTILTFEEDPEPYGRIRDHNITSKCREVGVSVLSRVSHTLFKLDRIIELNGGKAPLTYHQFQALIASMPPPLPAEDAISVDNLNGAYTPIPENYDERFSVPTLDELGFDTESMKPGPWIGGESEALIRLERHLERKVWVASFGRPKMTPQSLLASQTGLSPYLRFGCLSTRLFYYQLSDLYVRVKNARPPLSLHGQLLWREFFYCAATRNPNFDRMEGNPICVQIPWNKNVKALAKWGNAQTGFPWIDAIMTQLREEGWIHHLARHAVACFLTRGDLWLSWEEGMKIFDELLLDADWSVNAGMWMWWSCSSFFQQFFQCFCPVRFGRKVDPNGDYIRRYLPILKDIPTKYIHEPWIAPESVQESAKCIIGQNYPLPMIDHNKAAVLNIERIQQVYSKLSKYRPQEPPQTHLQPQLRPKPQPRPHLQPQSQPQALFQAHPQPQPCPQLQPQSQPQLHPLFQAHPQPQPGPQLQPQCQPQPHPLFQAHPQPQPQLPRQPVNTQKTPIPNANMLKLKQIRFQHRLSPPATRTVPQTQNTVTMTSQNPPIQFPVNQDVPSPIINIAMAASNERAEPGSAVDYLTATPKQDSNTYDIRNLMINSSPPGLLEYSTVVQNHLFSQHEQLLNKFLKDKEKLRETNNIVPALYNAQSVDTTSGQESEIQQNNCDNEVIQDNKYAEYVLELNKDGGDPAINEDEDAKSDKE